MSVDKRAGRCHIGDFLAIIAKIGEGKKTLGIKKYLKKKINVYPLSLTNVPRGTGYRVQGTGYRVQGTGYGVRGTGYLAMTQPTPAATCRPYHIVSLPLCDNCAMCGLRMCDSVFVRLWRVVGGLVGARRPRVLI